MRTLILTLSLALASPCLWAGFSCPDGTQPACLELTDKVCPSASVCASESATCFADYPCGPGEGFVCESKYNGLLNDFKQTVEKHNALASQNEALRVERLDKKNCVTRASDLAEARRCVR